MVRVMQCTEYIKLISKMQCITHDVLSKLSSVTKFPLFLFSGKCDLLDAVGTGIEEGEARYWMKVT